MAWEACGLFHGHSVGNKAESATVLSVTQLVGSELRTIRNYSPEQISLGWELRAHQGL